MYQYRSIIVSVVLRCHILARTTYLEKRGKGHQPNGSNASPRGVRPDAATPKRYGPRLFGSRPRPRWRSPTARCPLVPLGNQRRSALPCGTVRYGDDESAATCLARAQRLGPRRRWRRRCCVP